MHARVCAECLLVQTDPVVTPEQLFSEYAFFSGYSRSWVQHCREFAKVATDRFGLGPDSQVIEVASNDGTLLKEFDGPQVLGVEPAANVAEVARADGVETVCEFFGEGVARNLPQADLVVANNVLGHVPDLNDFVAGLATLLAPRGVLSLEFPWLHRLIADCQFDTIYHEHFSYFSLTALLPLFERHGLEAFDCDRLDVHGGSLRVYAARPGVHVRQSVVTARENVEMMNGLATVESWQYREFALKVERALALIGDFFWSNPNVAGAGAPAKGNTLLNAAGLTSGDIRFVTDTSPHKQGKHLPGSHIPVLPPSAVKEHNPDYLLVLAWNWLDEIIGSFPDFDGKFVVPIPELRVV